jgi:hypothetical protein
MSHKNDALPIFIKFQKYVERYFNLQIKSLQSDWGGEYRSLSNYITNCGIIHRVSCPHIHQQNGVVERKHRHIVETGLALLSHASIPLRFWDDACQYPTCTDDIQHNPVLEMNEKLHRLAVGVLEIGAESVENFNVLEKLLIDLKDNFPRSCDKQPLSQRKNSVGATSDVVRTEVVRSPMVVKRKGRPRMKQLKSSMEEAVSKSKKKRNTTVARNLTQSTSTTGVHN